MSDLDSKRPDADEVSGQDIGDKREQVMQPDEGGPAGGAAPAPEAEQAEGAAPSGEAAPEAPAEGGKKGRKAKKEKKKLLWWQEALSWLGYLLAAVVLAGLFRGLLFEPVRVDGGSMLGTLHDKEVMIVTKPRVLLGDLRRGDIVVCRFPNRISREWKLHLAAPLDLTLTSHVLFVKRLVALPGDTVAVMNGKLYINDELVEESYVEPERMGGSSSPRYTLQEDEYFVLGDNRANSQDSRYYGPITREMIVGHPRLVVLPLNRIRSL